MKGKRFLMAITPMILMWCGVASLQAQTSSYLHYQGYLTDTNGKPVNGIYIITFSFYDCRSPSTPIWSEPDTVEVKNGLYDVYLAGPQHPIRKEVFDAKELCFGIKIGQSELTPRKMVGSVLWAMKAIDAQAVNGIEADSIPQARKLLRLDNKGQFPIAVIPDSSVSGKKVARNTITVDHIAPNLISSIDSLSNDGGNIDFASPDSTVKIIPDPSRKRILFSAKQSPVDEVDPGPGLVKSKTGDTLSIAIRGVKENMLDTSAVTTTKIADNAITVAKIKPPILSSLNRITNDGGNINLLPDKDSTVVIIPDSVGKNIYFSAKRVKVFPGAGLEARGDTLKIANRGVKDQMLADTVVTEQKIRNNAVTEQKIRDNAVTVAKIKPPIISSISGITNDGSNIGLLPYKDSTVVIIPDSIGKNIYFSARRAKVIPGDGLEGKGDTLRIADKGVSGKKIADSTLTEKHIADNAVTAAKIRPNIISSINDIVNDGGNINLVPAADSTVIITTDRKGKKISFSARQKTIETEPEGGLEKIETEDKIELRIRNGGVTEKKIDDNAVTTRTISDNAVTVEKILPNIVSNINSVSKDGGNIKIVGSGLVSVKNDPPTQTIEIEGRLDSTKIDRIIAQGGLTGGGEAGVVYIGIADSGVTEQKIRNKALTENKLADNAVTTRKIADNAVTIAKIEPNIVSSVDGVTNDGGNIDFDSPDNTVSIKPDLSSKKISFYVQPVEPGEGLEKKNNKLAIATKGVTTPKIDTLAVTTGKIADNAITLSKIQPPIISSINHIVNDGGNIDLVPKNSSIIIEPNSNSKTISFSAGSIDWSALTNLPAWIANATIDGMKGGAVTGDIKVTNGHVEANKGLHIATSAASGKDIVGVAIDSVEKFGIQVQHSKEYGLAINSSASNGVNVANSDKYGVCATGKWGGGFFQTSASDVQKNFALVANSLRTKGKGLQVNGTSEFNGKATFNDTAEFKGPVLPEGVFSLQKTDAGIRLMPSNYGIEEEVYISGQAQLVNGFAQIVLGKDFQNVVTPEIEPRVIITPHEPAAGLLFVSKRSVSGFEVRLQIIPGLEDYSQNVEFDWLVVARRRGYTSREEMTRIAGGIGRSN